MQKIRQYFPTLSKSQLDQLEQLKTLYEQHNAEVNVVSRKDMDMLYLHHVLHSLTLCAFIHWPATTRVLDLGTGGGFPAIPLAIYFPEVQFTAIDGTGKKINVVRSIASSIGLKNLKAQPIRAESFNEKFHFVVSRAVTDLAQLSLYARHLLLKNSIAAMPNGLIAYKGGNLKDELNSISSRAYLEMWSIYDKFPEDYFLEKKLVYLQFDF